MTKFLGISEALDGKMHLVFDEPSGGSFPYSEGKASVVLKNAGASSHPFNYSHVSWYTKIGRRVFLDIRVFMLKDFNGGSGGDEFWLDLEGPEEIVPDFTKAGCLENAGTFHAWGGKLLVGDSYWSKNVGSGLDGIRMTCSNAHISKKFPVEWGPGDHWRISINYMV
jgi:hypothetical protein